MGYPRAMAKGSKKEKSTVYGAEARRSTAWERFRWETWWRRARLAKAVLEGQVRHRRRAGRQGAGQGALDPDRGRGRGRARGRLGDARPDSALPAAYWFAVLGARHLDRSRAVGRRAVLALCDGADVEILERAFEPYRHVDPVGWIGVYRFLPASAGVGLARLGALADLFGGRQLFRLVAGPLGALIATVWAGTLATRLGFGSSIRQVTVVSTLRPVGCRVPLSSAGRVLGLRPAGGPLGWAAGRAG